MTRPGKRVLPLGALVVAGGMTLLTTRPDSPKAGTQRMVKLLERIGKDFDQRLIELRPDPTLARRSRSDTRSQAASEASSAYRELLLGHSQEAARLFQTAKATLAVDPVPDTDLLNTIRSYLAISHLRRGEQDNCILRHTSDSCLLPIRHSGVHSIQTGSRDAIPEYLGILRANPNDLTARWLLNIAYMTVGEYPDEVPHEWLIPPEVFASDFAVKRFYDVAPQLGVDTPGLAGGCIMEDFDGDGFIDIMVSSSGLDRSRDQLRYFRNNGDGTFSDRTAEAGLLTLHPAQAAAWADYDNDGWLDVFIGFESGDVPYFDLPLYKSVVRPKQQPARLYHNNRDGTFTDVASQVGLAVTGYMKSAVWGDYNNDGRPDLFISRMYGSSLLFRNEGTSASGQWRFTNAAVMEPSQGAAAWFWDYNNDGWLDIFVSGYSYTGASYAAGQVASSYLGLPSTADLPRVYRNNAGRGFEDVTRELNLNKVIFAMAGNFGDIDNDGWPDFYTGTGAPDYRALVPNRMFRNAQGRLFQDVTTSAGVGHLQKGSAIAFGDINGDGTQDIYAVMGGQWPGDTFRRALFLNPGFGNHWITLRLEGVQSNRSAIGARITVTVKTNGKLRKIYTTVSSGGSFGASTLQQVVGLGTAKSIQALEVRWPASKKVQRFYGVRLDHMFTIREGQAEPTLVPSRACRIVPRGILEPIQRTMAGID